MSDRKLWKCCRRQIGALLQAANCGEHVAPSNVIAQRSMRGLQLHVFFLWRNGVGREEYGHQNKTTTFHLFYLHFSMRVVRRDLLGPSIVGGDDAWA